MKIMRGQHNELDIVVIQLYLKKKPKLWLQWRDHGVGITKINDMMIKWSEPVSQ